jgi:hypothetical protein
MTQYIELLCTLLETTLGKFVVAWMFQGGQRLYLKMLNNGI